ncbi:Ectopic P granules protein 5-like [Hondaea fermentalgiana]|uniref:Ectopic P granules protein 5-like n=1 Tax=Hondaea fermentalgiana TaxID=2315210 RepID=A0A2R5GP64_9STRA|nr:Ectopic P granules protein 5-like [Hondaea fermentalgiana]|eukprot:GBG32670.1 Ectopic P granules protein 5-like [Hondaea fermentalgiana]
MELARDAEDADSRSRAGTTAAAATDPAATGSRSEDAGLKTLEPVPLDLLYPPDEQTETYTDAATLERDLPDVQAVLHVGAKETLSDAAIAVTPLSSENADASTHEGTQTALEQDTLATAPSTANKDVGAQQITDPGQTDELLEQANETQLVDADTNDVEPSAPPLPPRSPLDEEELLLLAQRDENELELQARFAQSVHRLREGESTSEALARVSNALRPNVSSVETVESTHASLYPTIIPVPSAAPTIDREFAPSAPTMEQLGQLGGAAVDLVNVRADDRYLAEVLGNDGVLDALRSAEAVPYVNKYRHAISTLDTSCPDGLEPVEDEFTQLVLKFRVAEEAYEDFLGQLARRIEDCRLTRGQIWARKNGRAEQTQETRSGLGTVKASVSFQHAAFSRKKARAFETELKRIGDLRSKDLTSFGFDRTMTAFNVEQKIYEELALSPRFCSRFDGAQAEVARCNGRAEAHARIYFTILLSFELKTRRELEHERVQALASQLRWRRRFLRCVRAWLAHLGAALVQSGRLEDRFFLLRHIIAFPGVGSASATWALPFLQAGPDLSRSSSSGLATSASHLQDMDWSDTDIEVCLAMVQTLLQHADPLFGTADGYEVVEDTDPLDSRLSEADYIALLEQMPHGIAVERLLPSSEHVAALTPDQVKSAFARVHAHVLALSSAVTRLKWFTQLGRMLSQAVVRVVVRAGAFLRDLECWGARAPWAVAQMHFDRLVLMSAVYLLTSSNKNLRLAVRDLPLDRLSCEASWRLFHGLILGYSESNFSSLEGIYTTQTENGRPVAKGRSVNLSSNGTLSVENPGALFSTVRRRFAQVLRARDRDAESPLRFSETSKRKQQGAKSASHASPYSQHTSRLSLGTLQLDTEDDVADDAVSGTPRHGEALYRLVALSSLGAASSADLGRAVMLEISFAAFATPDSELAHEELLDPVCDMLAMICRAHPELTSDLLHFVSVHESQFSCERKRGLKLFRALPIRGWAPRVPEDTDILCSWLAPRSSAPGNEETTVLDARAEMAMAVLSDLDYSADANAELALEPSVHRAIAILIAEACMARATMPHLERVSHAGALATLRRWIPLTSDYTNSQDMVRFEHWCWTTLLSLSLYNTTTGEPLCPLVDVSDAADVGPGGALHHMWKTAAQRANVLAVEALRPTLPTGGSQSPTPVAVQDSLHKFVHPILSYVLLQTSNHTQDQEGWVPLKSLLHFSHPGVSTNWHLVERAYLSTLQTLLPRYAFELFDERSDFTFHPLPGAAHWLLPFLESTDARDRAMESSGGLVAVGSGLVGDLISRVLTPDSPQGATKAGPTTSAATTASPFAFRRGASVESISPSSVRSRSTSVASNGGTCALEKLVLRVGKGAAGRLRSLVETHVCAPLLCDEDGDNVMLRERMARCCVVFWVDQIMSLPQWQGLAACKTVLDGIAMATISVQPQLRYTDLPAEMENRICKYADHLIATVLAGVDSSTAQKVGGGGAAGSAAAAASSLATTSPEVTALSVLPAQAASGFFAKSDVSEAVLHCDWLSFEALLVETGREYPLWQAAGAFLARATNTNADLDNLRNDLDAELKKNASLGFAPRSMHVDFKKLSQYRIYRWANYALRVHADHPLLPLYWQVLLTLTFSRGANGQIFGMRFLTRGNKQTRRANVRDALLARARELQLHFKDLARRESTPIPSPTRPNTSGFRQRSSRRRFSVSRRRSSSTGSVGPAGGGSDADFSLHYRSSAHLESLSCFYGAVSLWLRDANPHAWMGSPSSELSALNQLGPDFCVTRLHDLLSKPLLQRMHEVVQPATLTHGSLSTTTTSEPSAASSGSGPDSHGNHSDNGAAGVRSLLWFDLVDLSPHRDDLVFSCGSWCPASTARRTAPSGSLSSTCGSSGRASSLALTGAAATFRPAPVYLYREPVMPASLDLSSVDVQAILHELIVCAQTYAGQTAQANDLAKEIRECLPHLYVQQSRVETVYEYAPSGKDPEPYQFDIPFEESVLDQDVDHRLAETWDLWLALSYGWMPAPLPSEKRRHRERFLSTSSVDSLSMATALAGASEDEQHVCSLVATLIAAVRHTCALASSKDATHSVKAHQRGLAWFRALLQAESPLTRAFPPAQRVLWTTISKTGHAFARTHEEDTMLILASMLEDPHRIHLLSPLFRPLNIVERLLDFYVLAWKSIPQIPARDMILVLEHFDFAPWLALKPSHKLRTKLLVMAASVLRQRGWKNHSQAGRAASATAAAYVTPEDAAAETKVFDFHVKVFLAVCKASPEEHFVEALKLLVGDPSIGSSFQDLALASENGAEAREAEGEPTGTETADSASTNLRVEIPQQARDSEGAPLNGKVWDAVLHEIGTGIWRSVDAETLFAACDALGSFYFQLRMNGSGSAVTVCTEPGPLVKQWGPLELVGRAARLAHKIILLMCALIRDSAHDESIWPKELLVRSWASLATLFRPWLLSEFLDKSPQEALSPLNPDLAGRYLASEVSVPSENAFWGNLGLSAAQLEAGHEAEPETGSQRKYEAPWTVGQKNQETLAAAVLQSFVACVSDLNAVSQQVEPFWVLDQVWWLFVDDLASSANKQVLATITKALKELPWKTWTLCDAILAEFLRLVASHTSSDPVFIMIRHMLEQLNWSPLAESDHRRFTATLAARGRSVEAAMRRDSLTTTPPEEFYAHVLRLTFTLLLKEPQEVPPSFCEYYFGVAHGLPWSHVDPNSFRAVGMDLEMLLSVLPKAEAARIPAQRASSRVVAVDTAEKKAVAAIRLFGTATSLAAQRQNARVLNQAAETSLSDALQRERCVLSLLTSQLRATLVSHKSAISVEGASASSPSNVVGGATAVGGGTAATTTATVAPISGLQKLVSESSSLPFSSGALVMLVYESMQRVLGLLADPEGPYVQACDHVDGVREIARIDSHERVLQSMDAALTDVFALLNVTGVVCVRAGSSSGGLQSGDLGVANLVFGKVENVLRSISESLPTTLQFHEDESGLHESAHNLGLGPGGDQNHALEAERDSAGRQLSDEFGAQHGWSESKHGRGDCPPGARATVQQWRYWKVMWRSVLPTMIAAARGEAPFDRIASVIPEEPDAKHSGSAASSAGARLAMGMRRLARHRAASTGSGSSQSSLLGGSNNESVFTRAQGGVPPAPASALEAESSFSVTGVGIGCLVHSFITRTPHCAPLHIVAALRSVSRDARAIEVVEGALESWFTVRTDLGPVIAALCVERDFGRVLDDEASILKLEACAIRRGAWHTWFVLELYALATGLTPPSEVLARVGSSILFAVRTEMTRPSGSFLRPSLMKLLPMIFLLFDLATQEHEEDPTVNESAFKVQQLHVAMAALQKLALDKAGMLSSLASAVFSRLPQMPFGASTATTTASATAPTTSTMSSDAAVVTGVRQFAEVEGESSGTRGGSSSTSPSTGHSSYLAQQIAEEGLSEEDNLRIYVRALQALVYVNSHRRSGALRMQSRDFDLNLESRKSQAAAQALTQTYSTSAAASWAWRFCAEPSHTMASYPTLVEELNVRLFPHFKYLNRPHNEWEKLHDAVRVRGRPQRRSESGRVGGEQGSSLFGAEHQRRLGRDEDQTGGTVSL